MLEKFDVFKDKENLCYQLRTKNTLFSIEFDDKDREDIFIEIVKLINENNSYTFMDIIKKVKTKNNYSKVLDVLQILDDNELMSFEFKHKDLIKKENKSNKNDITYKSVIPKKNLIVFSNGSLGDKIKKVGNSLSFKNIQVIPYQENINIEVLTNKTDLIVADATEWSPFHLEEINRIALKRNMPWLFIGGIEETSLKIGPLFFGKETGCYNCLISRVKSNHEQPAFLVSYENHLRDCKVSSKPDIVLNKELYENILANYVLIEIINFFEPRNLSLTWRTVVSVDVNNLETKKHKLLKKPFCEICKPELDYNSAPWLEPITL